MSVPNAGRLLSAGLGAATAFKLISKAVPEGQARTFIMGVASGGLAVGVADEVGVPVLEPIRFAFATLVAVGSKQAEELQKNFPSSPTQP